MTTTQFGIAERKLFDGEQYTASHNVDLANGESTSLLIENPQGSGTEMVLTYGDVTHEGETECIVFTDVSSISGGSSENITNDNVGMSNTSSVTATTDATYSTDNEHFRVVYTGTGVRKLFNGYKMIIQPGHNIVIELNNPGSSNDQVGMVVTWVEKPA